MTDATLVSKKKMRSATQLRVAKYTVESVGVGATSDEIRFNLYNGGKIAQISFECDSANFSVSLRDKQGVTLPSIHEFYSMQNINQSQIALPNYFFANDDTELSPYIYMVFTNDGLVVTGTINVRIFIMDMADELYIAS